MDFGFVSKAISSLFSGNGGSRGRAKTNLEKGEDSAIKAVSVVSLAAIGYKVFTGLRNIYAEKNSLDNDRSGNDNPKFHKGPKRNGYIKKN